ncbi:MAG: hypothetical protein ACMG5Z_06295, partial [Luteimonas sp.]
DKSNLANSGSSRFFDSPSMARSKNGAHPVRRPPGLRTLKVVLAFHLQLVYKIIVWFFVFAGDTVPSTVIQKTRRAACMDARRFPSRQDAESENPLEV